MSNIVVKERITPQKRLNIKQDLFCKLYATDSDIMGNASRAYMKAYGAENPIVAKASANKLMDRPEITAQINEYLSTEGFNNENVDKQLNYVINQHRDLNVKVKGIQEYNKLKKRITNTLEIVAPKPIMDLEDDETIHKIDKSKAKDVQQSTDDV